MILGFGVGGSGRVSTVLRRASLSVNSSVMVLLRYGTKKSYRGYNFPAQSVQFCTAWEKKEGREREKKGEMYGTLD